MVTNILKFGNKPHFGQRFDSNHWARKGLVGHWLMIKHGSVIDVSGYRNHGTISDGANWDIGRNGWATEYDGVDGKVVCGTKSILEVQEHTIIAMINPLTVNAHRIVCGKCDNINNSGFEFAIDNFGDLKFAYYDGVVRGWYIGTNTNIQAKKWQWVAYRWRPKDGQVDFLVNGKFIESIATTTGTIVYTGDEFDIGHAHTAANLEFKGKIDYVRFYNRVLNYSEMEELYRNPYPEYYTDIQWMGRVAAPAGGRIMSSLAYRGGLAGEGGIAGQGGGLAA